MTTSSLPSIPTMGTNGQVMEQPNSQFGVIVPTYVPEGVKQGNIEPVTKNGVRTVVLNYKGTYNYKLVEARPTEVSVTYEQGMPVNLGFTVGVLAQTDDNRRILTWELDGVEFMLAGDLPEEEMISVAQSTYGVGGK